MGCEKITHRKLVEDLAKDKGTKFFEVPLGSVWASGTQIADVITVKPSYTRFLLDIYEVKVSRSDFLSDIRAKKYEGYFNHCNRLYFAVLSGVAKEEEIPDGVGLIVKGDKGWSTIKAAKKRDIKVPYDTMMSLIFKKNSQDNFERRTFIANYAKNIGSYDKESLKKILNPKVKKALKFYDSLSYYQDLLTFCIEKHLLYDLLGEQNYYYMDNKTIKRKRDNNG